MTIERRAIQEAHWIESHWEEGTTTQRTRKTEVVGVWIVKSHEDLVYVGLRRGNYRRRE